jgi:peptidoglycan/LPS O-acetylase OafA/YrhL
VIIFHLPQLCKNQGLPYYESLPVFHKGMEAVYMFFVLSGFLIIRLIYRAKKRGAFSIKKFYIRRILRIFPLYYLILIIGFTFYNLILPFLDIDFAINYKLFDGILLTVFFLPNIFSTIYEPGGILEILWSIGIEEQFYLMIAPLLFFIGRRRIRIVLIVLTALYFVVFHLNDLEVLRRFKFVYFFIFSGGIIAILEEERKLDFLKQNKLIPLLIIGLTIVYFSTDLFHFNLLWLRNLLTTILFALFIHSISCNNHGFVLKSNVLNHFGQISYGIYMFHVIALNMVVFLFLKIDHLDIFSDVMTIILINILTFVLTILISHISYKYFESYFLKLKNKFR